MARAPLLLILAVAGAALLLTGMVNRQPAPLAESAPLAGQPDNGESRRLLEQAIVTYAPGRIAWAELTLWQRIMDDGAAYEVSGRYLAAPGHRVRLELQTQVGGTRGEVKLVSDGKVLWQWERLGAEAPRLSGVELPKLQPGLNTPEYVAWATGETLRAEAFAGVGALLQLAHERLHSLRSKAVRWKGLEIIQVTGDWPEDPAQLADVPDYLRPRHTPRLCSIYLDAKTLWPHRVEWWGSERPADPPTLLLQTEFRDPVLNRPLPPERCASEFGVPG
jgi:hypothetical protein